MAYILHFLLLLLLNVVVTRSIIMLTINTEQLYNESALLFNIVMSAFIHK